MRKRFRKMTAALLVVVMITLMIPFTTISVSAGTVVETAISWAVSIANDTDGLHLYSQSVRWGPSYDCSSFVISAFQNAGVDTGSASWTGNMKSEFTKHGFDWISWSDIGDASNLQRGDVLLYHNDSTREGHTEIYLGNNTNVGAHSANKPAADQISVSGYYYHPWQGVLRYKDKPYVRPSIVRTYINYQQASSYRVNIEVENPDSVSSVQVATWTQQDQSDLHWNSCAFNGGGTFFVDLSRADFATNQTSYCNDVYVYDTRGECVGYERIGTTYNNPEIVRMYINYQQSGTYRVNVEVTNVESISSVRVATWTKQDQSDLHWNYCAFNGGGTYYVDLSRADFAANQTEYCNDVYVYDGFGNCVDYDRIGTTYNDPAIVRTYINYQQLDSYRVNIEVTNVESISSVRVATWTQQDQSDLHWNYCAFNGGSTYYVDLSRADFATNQKEYCNDIYVYDGHGNCVDYARIKTIYTTPTIEDIRVTQISNNGYRVVCKMNSQFGIASAQLPTWTIDNGQDDLVWHDGTISGNYISCYIKSSDHNNEKNNYVTHLYITDNIGQYVSFSGILPYVYLSNECREISTCRYMKNKYVLYNMDFTWEEAKDWCENQGGHLACIQDESEWDTVKKQLEDYGGIPVWLGAKNNNGIWSWVTGEPLSLDVWASNQPDNMGGVENYLGIFNSDGYLDCYEWNDYQNTDQIGCFICEFENYYLTGDTNRDGIISVSDVTAIQRYLVELEAFNDEQIALADTNGDGEINIADATYLQMYLAEYDGIVLGKS